MGIAASEYMVLYPLSVVVAVQVDAHDFIGAPLAISVPSLATPHGAFFAGHFSVELVWPRPDQLPRGSNNKEGAS